MLNFLCRYCTNFGNMAPRKIIIDTDPGTSTYMQRKNIWFTQTNEIVGVDDVMAMLLALSASKEEIEVIMISVTYGNVPLEW